MTQYTPQQRLGISRFLITRILGFTEVREKLGYHYVSPDTSKILPGYKWRPFTNLNQLVMAAKKVGFSWHIENGPIFVVQALRFKVLKLNLFADNHDENINAILKAYASQGAKQKQQVEELLRKSATQACLRRANSE